MDFCLPKMRTTCRRLLLATAFLAALSHNAQAMGIGGQEMEKPAPVFSTEADRIVAKLIPRAKSTSVKIAFTVEGGTLAGLRTTDFGETSEQGVDPKNFKSGLFVLEIDGLAPGAAARLGMRSEFFTSGTAWYVFNPAGQPPWANAGAESQALGERVYDLTLTVTDGGPLDSDGRADGHLTVIGGPRDSFWGYAIGTLFIRFFGIFIVLGMLMIGMLASGWIFRKIEARRAALAAPGHRDAANDEPAAAPTGPAPEVAAAVAVALHLALQGVRSAADVGSDAGQTPWVIDGRTRMMNERQQIYRRAMGPGVHGDQHS
jgi:hypothetical protein